MSILNYGLRSLLLLAPVTLAGGGAAAAPKRPPLPHELVRIDYETKRISFSLLIVGENAQAVLAHFFERTRAPDAGTRGHLFRQGELEIEYIVASLPLIQGWDTRFHLYALSGKPGAEGTRLASDAGAMLVAGSPGEFEPLHAQMRERSRPIAVCGEDPYPSGAVDCTFPAIKSLAKALLIELKKDQDRER